ncbi:hypothetical protein [Shewanella maritima]|uniref:DUF7281 domain-containing protein n=1 Tax=Shewanella maritima TaxID=2520507 RepID=UPI0037367C68
MASLSRAQIKAINTVVTKRQLQVKLTANWRAIYQHFDVGEIDGVDKKLILTRQDHQLLHQLVKEESGLDVFNLDFDADRHQMANVSHKEKLANVRPEANYVLVKQIGAQPSNPQLSNALSGIVDDEASMRLPVDSVFRFCQNASIQRLIVVENLDSFDAIAKMNFDEAISSQLDSTLFVYRGGGANSPAGCKRLLQLLSNSHTKVKVLAFTDLDAAGLQIAQLLIGCEGIIIPKMMLNEPEQLVTLKQVNDLDDYHKQHKQVSFLKSQALQAWTQVFKSMQQFHINVKQQHMLAHSLELTLLMR